MSDIRLICLDFDGTIMSYDGGQEFFHPLAVDMLNRLPQLGIAWCTNSGREQQNHLKILETSRARGLCHMPSALLCSESLIFPRRDGRYESCENWNRQAIDDLKTFHGVLQHILHPFMAGWMSRYEAMVYAGDTYTTLCVPDVDNRSELLFQEMIVAIRPVPRAMVTRNGGWLSFLPEHLGKGNVLRAYLKMTGVGMGQALAIGDHFNDLSMLDGRVTRNVGCPGSAVPDVVQSVRVAQGHVASVGGPEGTIEVVEYFLARKPDA